ncbi:MAG: hypothetical protein ABI247_13555, partial [Rhodanobacter sp.]
YLLQPGVSRSGLKACGGSVRIVRACSRYMASGLDSSLASESRGYLAFFFSCLAAFFSFMVFSGFFFSLFFESMPLLMLLSAVSSGG